MVSSILQNTAPRSTKFSQRQNAAISGANYLSLLQGLVEALRYRRIGVLLSLQTLTPTDSGALWFNPQVTENNTLTAIDLLAASLCSNDHWNVLGIDLKNEPYGGTWGDSAATDFRAGAERLGNRMLAKCPQWLGFVQGVSGTHSMAFDGSQFDYNDWFGGGLQGAKTWGLQFNVRNKVVWAPHYYSASVFPQPYLFDSGTPVAESGALAQFVELDDALLRARVEATMNDMFGFLASATGPAMVLGHFGGLYATDKHPKRTSRRTTDIALQLIAKTRGWAGGFAWSLNPESLARFNPADQPGAFTEGLLNVGYASANTELLQGLAVLDQMEALQPFPCF